MKRLLLALTCVLLGATMAQAAPIIIDLGTGAPPASIGGQLMTPFPPDGSPLFSVLSSLPSPLGGSLGFAPSVDHRMIGLGWATWSHGYTGDVYYTQGATSLTFGIPAGTTAFYFYAEPNPFSVHMMTVTSGGVSFSKAIDGSGGAGGFGIYDLAGLGSITISSDVDFAVGEFGISRACCTVPEPGSSLVFLGIGLAGLSKWRKRLL
jgi:hypothetical protein